MDKSPLELTTWLDKKENKPENETFVGVFFSLKV